MVLDNWRRQIQSSGHGNQLLLVGQGSRLEGIVCGGNPAATVGVNELKRAQTAGVLPTVREGGARAVALRVRRRKYKGRAGTHATVIVGVGQLGALLTQGGEREEGLGAGLGALPVGDQE